MYVTTLLIDGFGLNGKEIIVAKVLNGFNMDWSIGSLVFDINAMECDYMDVNTCGITPAKS